MTYLIVLMSLLVVLAGVISYTGDVLGTIVGKRRLSLFGARPKRSGQIIGVLAGILIMLVTLVTLALAFSNARRALFEFQSVSEQNAQLSFQQKSLLQQVTSLEDQVTAQTKELEAARLELDAAVQDRNDAQAELKILEQQQDSLIADIDTLTVDVKNFERDLEAAQADLEVAQTAFTETQETLVEAQSDREQALADVEAAKADVEEAQTAVTDLETQVTEAQSQLESVQKELDTSQQELDIAQTSLETAQTELETIQGQLELKQTELDEAQLALDNAVKARDEAVTARDEAQAQQQELSEANEKLNVLNQDLELINATLRTQVLDQNAARQRLEEQVTALTDQLAQQASALELAQTQAQAVNSRNLTYTVNQVVHTGIIDAQDLASIQAQFAEILSAANDKAIQMRSGDIILEPAITESVTQAALQTPGSDVLTLRSRQNQYVSKPLSVTVEVAENKMLVEEGQLVVTQQIHLGSPEFQEQRDSVRSDLSKLFTNANSSLLAKGLADGIYPVTSETSLEIEGFTNQLLRLSGPVVVGLTASDDIYSGGPAKLEFIILN